MDEQELSDESFIEGTPEKKRSKIFKHRTKVRNNLPKKHKSEDVSKSCLLEKLVEEFDKNITQATVIDYRKSVPSEAKSLDNKKSLTQSCSQETSILKKSQDITNETISNSIVKEDEIPYCGITEPIQKPFSKNSHKMFVFYLIEEFLKFSPNYFPKNSHIQLVGVITYSRKNNEFIMCSIEQTYKHFEIKVDLRELMVKPSVNDKIILFGLLSFEEQIPMLLANFFQQLTVVYSVYRELMLKLRTTVPLENFEMVSVNSEDRVTVDSVFEETDNDNIEEFCDIFTQKMGLEKTQQQFTDDCFSDSTLHAFLDEISFEHL